MTITRRNLLAGAGAAAATTLLARSAAAQSFPFTPNQRYPDPAVQILDPSFAKYRIYSSTVEQVATGMRWAEGPAYFPEGGYLLFSDIPNNRIMKFDEKTNQTSVFRANANYANGNARDRQGRLVTCEHSVTRRVTRTEKDGKITVLADKFEGKRLNAPNDIVVKADDTHLVHRSPVRHQWRMGRQEGKARAGHHQRVPPHQGRQADCGCYRYR
jgi:gluconolactonase